MEARGECEKALSSSSTLAPSIVDSSQLVLSFVAILPECYLENLKDLLLVFF